MLFCYTCSAYYSTYISLSIQYQERTSSQENTPQKENSVECMAFHHVLNVPILCMNLRESPREHTVLPYSPLSVQYPQSWPSFSPFLVNGKTCPSPQDLPSFSILAITLFSLTILKFSSLKTCSKDICFFAFYVNPGRVAHMVAFYLYPRHLISN